MIISIIASFVLGFIAGALIFRNNATKVNTAISNAETKVENVVTEIKK